MKYAWWLIVGFILFLLCTQQTFAAEVAGFDPTQQYVVHSVPMYTEGSVVVSFEDEKKSPVVTPVEHTPEAGSEGKQEYSLAESSVNQESKTDLSDLTYKSQKAKSSFFSRLGDTVSSWFSFVKDEVSSFFRSGWANASANLMQFSFSSILAISSKLNKWIGDLTFLVNKYISFVREHALSFALLSVAGPGLALFASTALGKAVLVSLAHFVVAGVVSLIDLVLHAGSYSFGLLNAVRTGSTINEGYETAKDFVKKKTGHDIGDFGSDAQVVITRVVIVLMVFAATQFLVAGVAAVGTISAETAPELILRSNIALSKTSTDCGMPGQCDTPAGLGFTAGSNFLFGVAPKANMQFIDDEARAVKSVIVADETEEVSKYWYRSTFDTVDQSIEYHMDRHAIDFNKSATEYTKDALEFFLKNKYRATEVILKDGSEGLQIKKLKDGVPGGYFTKDGKVVSFWYK